MQIICVNIFAQAPRPFPVGMAACFEDDFRELEKLYDATNGGNWFNQTNWLTNPDLSTWYGVITVSCDVTELQLGGNSFSGILPDLNLPNLTKIDLNSNDLSGRIPNLNTPNLKSIDLSYNNLSGDVPDYNSVDLYYLNLENNKFVFGDMLGKSWLSMPGGLTYYPQQEVDLTYDGGVLQMNTGIPNSTQQTIQWYRQGIEVATTNSNQYATTQKGGYIAIATHEDFPSWALESNTFVINLLYPSGLPSCLEDDFDQLLEFYNNTGGNSWTNKTNWLTGNDMASWHGIVLTTDGCSVKEINLPNNNLIDGFSTLYLSKLDKVDLSQNNLSGNLPDFPLSLNSIDVSDNKYTFENLQYRNWINLTNAKYAPQKKIPIYREEALYVVLDGGQQYEWYKDNVWLQIQLQVALTRLQQERVIIP